ncbi:MAG: hypothetical protein WBG86_17105 [Polyangiales bacterium]
MNKTTMSMVLSVLMLAASLWASSAALAQGKKKRQPKVIQLEEIVIEGRVQKPNAFYILNRSNLGYEVLELRTTFLRDVVRSVQEEPF